MPASQEAPATSIAVWDLPVRLFHWSIVVAIAVSWWSAENRVMNVHRYSGYPGGLKTESYGNLLGRKPADAIRLSVRGMLPKGPLGRQMIKKLKVYAGTTHPHEAQQPKELTL